MNAIINVETSGDYGFPVHNWSLHVTFSDKDQKSFYLGQDNKFCSRVLGLTGRQVAEAIGSNDLSVEKTRHKLAKYIINTLELTEEQLKGLQVWELCCQ